MYLLFATGGMPGLVGFSWAVDKKSARNQQENAVKTTSAEVHNERGIGLSKLLTDDTHYRIDGQKLSC